MGVILFLLVSISTALQITLQDHRARCFRKKMNQGEVLSGRVVLSGHEEDHVLFYVEDHDDNVLYHVDNQRDFPIDFLVPKTDTYHLCFRSHDYFHKVVSFDLRVGDPVPWVVQPEQLYDLGALVGDAYRRMEDALMNQGYKFSREQAHQRILHQGESFLYWCGGIKLVIIISITALQIYVLTSFFRSEKTISSMI
eukprot:TRINITY_DN4336_c0_g6_i1.p1 TRINITY_DN4336_c0_g6~~TRINITY_DN4336_c0_g6_i1.p1  ORF type:complete len:206 (+),score=31.46 TRINITY_DN4336_c0_g6_i1:33-620(+)